MTVSLLDAAEPSVDPQRRRPRRYLMCPPDYFDVVYSINPWMDPSVPVNRRRAARQWEHLVTTYRELGHAVEMIEPEPDRPDMVFSANSAIVIGGRVLTARFRHGERVPEQTPYRAWFEQQGFTEIAVSRAVNEGEGDFVAAGPMVLGGWGFRSSRAAHAEVQDFFGLPVVSLQLVDPRFYHLDTALCVLDAGTVAYFPPAFSPETQRVLERRFPDAIRVSERDALTFGLNAVSDGHHVVLPRRACGMADALQARGFEPVPVDVSEFHKAGGAVKCCTLELRGSVGP